MSAKVLLLGHERATISRRAGEAISSKSRSGAVHPRHVEAKDVIADVDVIVGLGHHIPKELIVAATKLKWIQALTTGTDSLTAPGVMPPHVLLTSTRGIHGPQEDESELAFPHHDRAATRSTPNAAQPGRSEMGSPVGRKAD